MYDFGEWYIPCLHFDESCHNRMSKEREEGVTNLTKMAGYHRYQGTWKPCMGECHKSLEHRQKGEQRPMQGLNDVSSGRVLAHKENNQSLAMSASY